MYMWLKILPDKCDFLIYFFNEEVGSVGWFTIISIKLDDIRVIEIANFLETSFKDIPHYIFIDFGKIF